VENRTRFDMKQQSECKSRPVQNAVRAINYIHTHESARRPIIFTGTRYSAADIIIDDARYYVMFSYGR